MARTRTALALGLALASCVGTPVPIPTPIDTRQIQLSAPTQGKVTVAALAGAVPADAELHITNATRGAVAAATPTAEGTFSAVIEAAVGDELRFEARSQGRKETALMTVKGPGRAAPTGAASLPGLDGKSTVTGEAAPGDTVVCSLPRTGEVRSATADAQGGFSLSLRVVSGDLLYIFALDDLGEPTLHLSIRVGASTACIDTDGDGYGARDTDISGCPASTTAFDCNDKLGTVHPGQNQFFSDPIPGASQQGAFDYDCDGVEQQELTSTVVCTKDCGGEGWEKSVPACGAQGSWVVCEMTTVCGIGAPQTRTQRCH